MDKQQDSLLEVFYSSLSLFFKKFHIFFAIAIIIGIIVKLFARLLRLVLEKIGFDTHVIFEQIFSGNLVYFSLLTGFETFLIIFGALFFSILFYSLVTYAIIFTLTIINDLHEEKKISFKENFKTSFKKTPKMFYTLLFADFLLVLLYLCLIIPGIVFSVFWILVIPVVLFNNKKGLIALNTSMELVSKRWFTSFFVLIITSVVMFFLLNGIDKLYMNFHHVIYGMIFPIFFYIITSTLEILTYTLGLIILLKYYFFVIENHAENKTQSKKQTKEDSVEMAKNYIEEYRSSYSKQAIQNALTKQIGDEEKVKKYMNKYY